MNLVTLYVIHIWHQWARIRKKGARTSLAGTIWSIVRRADRQVRESIKAAQIVCNAGIERIGKALQRVSTKENVEPLRDELNLHHAG